MKRRAGKVPALALALAAGAASAQYSIKEWTIDTGGGRSQSGPYVVTGTIGQADADALQPIRGGPYALVGGYWAPGATPPDGEHLFRNGFE